MTSYILQKWTFDARDDISLTVGNWLNHDAWRPAFNNHVASKIDGHVPDGPGAWLVVEDQVTAAAAGVGNPLQLLVSPEVAGVPFIAWVGMANGADRNRADPAGVKTLDNQAGAVSTVAGH